MSCQKDVQLSDYTYLNNVKLSYINRSTVQLLIGANVPKVFRMEAVKPAPQTKLPDAVRTPLGWSLLGPSFTSGPKPKDKELSNNYMNTVGCMFLVTDENEYFVNEEYDDSHSSKAA